MSIANLTLSTVQREQIQAGKQRARIRETILGLLFVAPAALITAIFGLYPVISGFFISMQGNQGFLPIGFVGLQNYFSVLGGLAYLVMLAVGLSLIIGGYQLFRAVYRAMRAGRGDFYPYLIPASIAALGTILFFGLAFGGLMELGVIPLVALIVAIAIYAYLESRQHSGLTYIVNSWAMMLLVLAAVVLIPFTFSQMRDVIAPPLAALAQSVTFNTYMVPLESQFNALLGAAGAAGAAVMAHAIYKKLDPLVESRKALFFGVFRWVMLIVAIAFILYILGALDLLRGTISALKPDKLATVTSMRPAKLIQLILVWPQVFTILLGIILIGLAFAAWTSATRRESMAGMLGVIGMAILFMAGGWMLIGQLPDAMSSGDPEFYQSLLRTTTYAILTVPVQLSLGLLLAYLLFYEVTWGKSFYRLVFFIPYVAPIVATAAVFSVIFSLRSESPANQFMHLAGLPDQQWLRSTQGIFEMMAQWFNGGKRVQLPGFLVGPSLPLVSAAIYSVWVFSGYDAVIFLAGLGAVSRDMIEAAQVDGAGRWENFRHVIFPLISPTTFFLTVLALIGTFKAFEHIYVLRGQDSRDTLNTATVYIFRMIREASSPWSYAAAAAFVLFGIIVILTLGLNRLTRDQVFYG